MIKLTIEIELARGPDINEFGAGVHVYGEMPPRGLVPTAEGATLVGIGMAINSYMRSRGCPNFNCLKQLGVDQPGGK